MVTVSPEQMLSCAGAIDGTVGAPVPVSVMDVSLVHPPESVTVKVYVPAATFLSVSVWLTVTLLLFSHFTVTGAIPPVVLRPIMEPLFNPHDSFVTTKPLLTIVAPPNDGTLTLALVVQPVESVTSKV